MFYISVIFYNPFVFVLGPTATAELRKRGCICPVIGITGNVLPEDKKYFMDCGALEVLPKPLCMNDLQILFDSFSTEESVNAVAMVPLES